MLKTVLIKQDKWIFFHNFHALHNNCLQIQLMLYYIATQ